MMVNIKRSVTMEQVESKRPHKKQSNKGKRFDSSFRLRLVKLHVEDGHALDVVSREGGVSRTSLQRWIGLYRKGGIAALNDHRTIRTKRALPEPVKEKIVSIKNDHPEYGVHRIADALRRWFCLPGSPESVRRVLVDKGIDRIPGPKRRTRNVTRPRFFERATPNQMWQTDIFTFRLGGRYAYLIGFVDDYSRYMVGLELYLSQTAENLIELYRRSTAEYGVPKEMLTDNGRQYTNWRGTSRFEAELQKDKTHHIKSSPHHPMTLGKIERFWKTIYVEFLVRAQFESFENARDRIRLWVKYYNHRRPHQGIGGLCPADRYFEIHNDLRKTIEAGIKENMLEMALRGKPKEPFYMVGRFEGKSVVLRAEKGKLKVSVDKGDDITSKELEYDIAGGEENGQDKDTEEGRDATTQTQIPQPLSDTHGATEMRGDTLPVVGETDPLTGLSRVVNHMDYIESVAGTGAGGNASGTGTPGSVGQGTCAQPTITGNVAEEEIAVALTAPDGTAQRPSAAKQAGTCLDNSQWRMIDEREPRLPCAPTSGSDPAGTQWVNQCERRLQAASDLPQNVLRMGEERDQRFIGITQGWGAGQAITDASGPGESNAGAQSQRAGTGARPCEADHRGETTAGRLPTAAEAAAARYRDDR